MRQWFPWLFVAALLVAAGAPIQNSPVTVGSVASLRSLTTSAAGNGTVTRLGYNTPGDSSALVYKPGTGSCAVDDGLSCVDASGGGQWDLIPPTDGLTPMEAGAAGNGTTDDTTAVQTALAAADAFGISLDFDAVHRYLVSSTLTATLPPDLEGPYRYGLWTNAPDNSGRNCSWGLITSMNATLLQVSAVTGTVRGVCMQNTGSGNTTGAAITFAPPSTTTYQTGVTVTYNTIRGGFWDGITLNGAGYSAGCCGEGTTADGNVIEHNTITDFIDAGISIGKNTANAATPGNTVWDNAIGCISAASKAAGMGVALYDGEMNYNGTANGPEGCNIGVAVIPGTVNSVGQNAQVSVGSGVLGDQSGTYALLIQPGTSQGIVGFSTFEDAWGAGSASGPEVLIGNANGGIIQGLKFNGGYFHSVSNQSSPIVDIEGNASSAGKLGDLTFGNVDVDCWGGGTCTAPLFRINGPGSGQPRSIVLSGGVIGENEEAGHSACDTGLQIEGASSPAWVSVTGVDLSMCSTPVNLSGLAATGQGSDITFSNNTGYYPATQNTSATNPTGTPNTTGVMMGLGGTFQITPKTSGQVSITIMGEVYNSTVGDGSKFEIAYGTGTPPANGAAAAGTTCGSRPRSISSSATAGQPYALTCLLQLNIGTTYWFDINLAAVTGGTSSLFATSDAITEK